jgi:GT2 family glycosyltransferase
LFATLHFADVHSEYNEACKVQAVVQGERTHVRLTLPPDAPRPSRLQLNPVDSPGWYLLSSLYITDEEQQPVWEWLNDSEGVTSIGLIDFPLGTTGAGRAIYVYSSDPHLHLTLPSSVAGKLGPGYTVNFTIELLEGDTFLSHLMSVREALASGRRQIKRLQIESALRELHEEAAQSNWEKLKAANDTLTADQNEILLRVQELERKLRSSEQQRTQLLATIDRYESDLQAQGAFAQDLSASYLRTLQESRQAQREAASVSEKYGQLESEYERISAEFHHFRNSAAGRLGSAMGRVAATLPRRSRKHIRRAAKAAYWMLTPHKIPARLRYRKVMRSAVQPDVVLPVEISKPQEDSQRATPDGSVQRSFAFRPGEAKSSSALAHWKGRYELSVTPGGYVYLPPRRPEKFSSCLASIRVQTQFSIVVPVFNTPSEVFRSMVASVRSQWYPFWELILVDDCSTDATTVAALRAAEQEDDRIRVIRGTENKGISGATNDGIHQAAGDYVVFLDHDDELTEDCLFELAKSIDREQADYLYSDEDKISPTGEFTEPFFKPDWSPDTLMSTMYTCHVSCVRRELLSKVGLLRSQFDGSQDWDLVLRITEQAKKICHIPKILYHWRMSSQSVAAGLEAKPYVVEAGRGARAEAMTRRGVSGYLQPVEGMPGYFRASYIPQGAPQVSIIIPSKNNGSVLKRCVDSIVERTRYKRYEFVILDNGSTESETLKYLESISHDARIKVVRDASVFNWSALNNHGALRSSGDLLLFLNDDTEVRTAEWLEEMVGYAQLKHIGAVGAKLLYPPGDLVQHNGIVNLADAPNHMLLRMATASPGPFGRNLLEYNCIAVTGACLMVERAKFEAAGGFDERFPIAYNDVEFCFRLVKRGFFNIVCKAAQLIHYESASRGLDHGDSAKARRLNADRRRLYCIHPEYVSVDPFHNINLHPNDLHFGVPQ